MLALLAVALVAAAPEAPRLSMVHATVAPRVASARPPLLVMLHGARGSERSFPNLATAVDARFRVVIPRAPLEIAPGEYAWFPLDRDHRALGDDVARADAALVTFVDEAVRGYGADPARVYIVGFSQGAMMALRLALLHPSKFAGAAVLSGTLLPDVPKRMPSRAELAGLPLFIAHGTSDSVLPIAYARAARDFLDPLPVRLTYAEYPMGHELCVPERDALLAWLTAQLDARR